MRVAIFSSESSLTDSLREKYSLQAGQRNDSYELFFGPSSFFSGEVFLFFYKNTQWKSIFHDCEIVSYDTCFLCERAFPLGEETLEGDVISPSSFFLFDEKGDSSQGPKEATFLESSLHAQNYDFESFGWNFGGATLSCKDPSSESVNWHAVSLYTPADSKDIQGYSFAKNLYTIRDTSRCFVLQNIVQGDQGDLSVSSWKHLEGILEFLIKSLSKDHTPEEEFSELTEEEILELEEDDTREP